jgi:hypothetical protein
MPEKTGSKFAAFENWITDHPAVAGAGLAVVTFLSCYFRMFVFPNVPMLPGGDAVGFFFSGNRMLAGELPYRDFAETLAVGTDLFYAATIKIFGFYTWVPDLVMPLLAAGTAFLLTLGASRVTRGLAILLPGLILVNFAMPNEAFNATHHWFSAFFAVAALVVLSGGTSFARVAGAGALAGLATCFTQTTGGFLVAAMAIYLVCRSGATDDPARWRKAALIFGASVAVFAAVNGYFIWRAGVGQWFASVVVFPVKYFRIPAFNNWRVVKLDFRDHPAASRWVTFPFVYALVPFTCAFFGMVLRRRPEGERTESRDRLLLVTLCGLAMFLAVISAPSLLRLSSASPPSMILIGWLLGGVGKLAQKARIAAAIVTALIAIAVPIQHQRRSYATLDVPGGKTAFENRVAYQEDSWLQGRVRPGQYFFGAPTTCLLFHMRNPSPIFALENSDYTRPAQIAATVRALQEHDVPIVIINDMPTPPTVETHDNSGPYREFIGANYRPTKEFPNGDVVWEKIR